MCPPVQSRLARTTRSALFTGSNGNFALIALTVGWLLPTRPGASAVMAGLDPAIHAAPPQRRVVASPQMVAKASGVKLFEIAAPLSVIHAPKHMDGPDKPRHDASGPFRAAPIFGIPWLPTPNAIRSGNFFTKNGICASFSKSWNPTRRPIIGRPAAEAKGEKNFI